MVVVSQQLPYSQVSLKCIMQQKIVTKVKVHQKQFLYLPELEGPLKCYVTLYIAFLLVS